MSANELDSTTSKPYEFAEVCALSQYLEKQIPVTSTYQQETERTTLNFIDLPRTREPISKTGVRQNRASQLLSNSVSISL